MEKSTLLTWQYAQVNVCPEEPTSILVHSTQDLTDLLSIVFGPSMSQPPYVALLLSKTNHLIGWSDITRLHKSSPIIDKKKLITSVYNTRCRRVIVVHRSPVSKTSPLDGEYMFCFKLQMVINSYGVSLKDLIIWNGSDYFSFEETGMVMKE